jgi:hypothetical protein
MGKALLIGILLIAAQAQARLSFHGPSTGGGGFIVFCPATPYTKDSVELVDLYEARSVLGFTLANASGDLVSDYIDAVHRIHHYQGESGPTNEDLKANLKHFFEATDFIDDASKLPQVDDLGPRPSIPPQCMFRQIAYFDDTTKRITIVKELWDKMDSLNQAALVQHEVSYRTFRQLSDFTSRYSRRMVAHAYAVRGPVSLYEGLNSNSLRYTTDGQNMTEFFATPQPGIREMIRLQFTFLEGRPLLSKTYVDLPKELWQFDGECNASRPDTNQSFDLPIQGAMLDGDILRYTYRTGEKATFELVRDGEVISRSQISKKWGCNGTAN